MNKARQLTTKQEAFKEAIITGATPIDAARKAGYKGNAGVMHTIGYKMVRNGTIKEAIAKRKADMVAKTDYTIEQAEREYEQARALAMRINQPAAASSAVTGKARLYSMDQPGADKGEAPDQLSEADLATLRTMAKAITDKGLSGPQLAQGEGQGGMSSTKAEPGQDRSRAACKDYEAQGGA